MSRIKEFLKPRSVREAVERLREKAGRVPLAGGTFLGVHCPPRVTGLVDLSEVGLDYVRRDGEAVLIGAMTTLAGLADSRLSGALGRFAGEAATEPLRQMITVGGNVMVPLRWSDLPLVLYVMEAEFAVVGERKRTYKAEEFFGRLQASASKGGELLTEVRLRGLSGLRVARRKLVRNYGDIPGVQVAVACRVRRGVMEGVRVAYVGQRAIPRRLKGVEGELEGRRPLGEVLERASSVAREEAGTLTDVRYSSEYLREMVGRYVARAIEECSDG
ncbi:MAG: FAD binding domain-containing protein [bacterium]|nr:FAD binding domain-containing protein [bacterium]